MNRVKIILRDGLVEVKGRCQGLVEKLRYFRRELSQVGWKREVKGRWEELYSVSGDELYTMQGFAHRVLEHCRNANIPFDFEDRRTPMPKPDFAKAFEGMRPYQIDLVGKMLASGGGILMAATGAGKTRIAAAIIRAFDRDELISRHTPVCVFACPNKDINRKNWEEFKTVFPDRDVGIIMSGANKPSDDIVCCSIDSLEHLDPESVGVLICDEVHTSASDTRAAKITSFAKAAKWGVSATPDGRFDGKDLVSEGLYGPIVAKFTYQDGIRTGALVPVTVIWIEAPQPTEGLEGYANLQKREAKIRHGSTANAAACLQVADILNCVPDSLQTLCVVQLIDHMSRIHKHCKKTGFVHGETDENKCLSYPTIGAVSAKERKATYEAFKNGEISSMISTGVWATGVDFPDLRVVINAGGCGSDILTKQILGRASRKADGKDRAYIVDFVHPWDRSDPVSGTGRPGPLLSNDNQRRKAYKDLGFEQITCTSITQLPFLERDLALETETVKRLRQSNQIL